MDIMAFSGWVCGEDRLGRLDRAIHVRRTLKEYVCGVLVRFFEELIQLRLWMSHINLVYSLSQNL